MEETSKKKKKTNYVWTDIGQFMQMNKQTNRYVDK